MTPRSSSHPLLPLTFPEALPGGQVEDWTDAKTHSCTEAPLVHQGNVLVVMQVGLKRLLRDEVIFHPILLMALPGPGGICEREEGSWAEMSQHSEPVPSFLSGAGHGFVYKPPTSLHQGSLCAGTSLTCTAL